MKNGKNRWIYSVECNKLKQDSYGKIKYQVIEQMSD